MIFVDTNYFVRFFLGERSREAERAKELFYSGSNGEITLVSNTIVFFEIYWVMNSYYELKKEKLRQVLLKVLALKYIVFDERELLSHAVDLLPKTNYDLEDAYNLTWLRMRGCDEVASFDQKLMRGKKKLV